MKISLYYNQQMYLLQDSEDADQRVIRIEDHNVELVYGTTCLYENNTNNNSVLFEIEASVQATRGLINEVLKTNNTINRETKKAERVTSFAVSRMQLKMFFERYRVKEIYPLQYVLRKINGNGLVGIVASEFVFIKECRDEYLLATNNSGISSGGPQEFVSYRQTREIYEDTINSYISTGSISNVVLFSAYDTLNLQGNWQPLEVRDIYKAIQDIGYMRISDTISDIYKKNKVHRILIYLNIFLIVLGVLIGTYYVTNQIRVSSLEKEIADINAVIDQHSVTIDNLNQSIPQMNLDELDVDAVDALLSRYTIYSPDRITYKFKNKDNVSINFEVRDAYLAEKLLEFLRVNKIKHKYKKSVGYTFIFDIDEKISKKVETKGKRK